MQAKINVEVDRIYLKKLREERDYSISDIAAYLGYKTPSGYWLLEQAGRKDPRTISATHLFMLAKLYKIPMEKLFIITKKKK